MREIKFRAWVKPIQIFANRQYGYMIDVSVINFEEKWVSDDEETVYEFHEIELMQYTGLKGSNGVEIYEGYIIRGMDMLSARTGGRVVDREVVGQVVIDSSSVWGFSIVVYETEYHLNDFLENDQEAEVIGNIHENPELLEDLIND